MNRRRVLTLFAICGAVGLGGCGGGSDDGESPAPPMPTTGTTPTGSVDSPISRARSVADQQSEQQRRLDQQTGAETPTGDGR